MLVCHLLSFRKVSQPLGLGGQPPTAQIWGAKARVGRGAALGFWFQRFPQMHYSGAERVFHGFYTPTLMWDPRGKFEIHCGCLIFI